MRPILVLCGIVITFSTLVCGQEQVLTGIDVLKQHRFAALKGKRVGLLTNQTGTDREGRRTIDVLTNAPGVKLVRLFSVEHGIAGKQDSLHVNETKDAATGIPVVNVYGAGPARTPTAEQLSGIDALIVDLQDAGVRFYTYEASMAEFITAAAKNNIEVVVLDRPNPLNGQSVQGPMTDEEDLWPNFPLRLPLRHGMTMGELAQMLNGERHLGAKLQVIKMQNWSRSDWFDATALLWVDPSPNLRSLTAATLYPGVAMLEGQGSNISVGRGTDTPFEIIGAPWIDAVAAMKFAAYLNHRDMPGVRFVPREFMPQDNIFRGETCHGMNLLVTDRERLDVGLLGAELTAALLKFFPKDFHADANRKLIGEAKALEALKAEEDPRKVAEEWKAMNDRFRKAREKYLLY